MNPERDREIERALLGSPARALCGLLREGGRMRRSALKKYVGSQYAYAIHTLVLLGLATLHGDGTVELTEQGKSIASCFCKCFELQK